MPNYFLKCQLLLTSLFSPILLSCNMQNSHLVKCSIITFLNSGQLGVNYFSPKMLLRTTKVAPNPPIIPITNPRLKPN